ncbi:MAG TPA: VC0807 family protein [Pseudonocardiaceae bacterium]|nr:VC0807 family protein [Pseudonocardiaceae bacterium]
MAGGDHRTTNRRPATGNPFLPLLLDVGVPLGSYYLLRHFDVSIVTALAVSGLLPAIRVVWSVIRQRSADGLALAVLTLTVVSIPVAFLTGSPKLLLAKDSLGTGVLGVWLAVSVLLGRPAMSDGIRAFLARTEGSAAAWERLAAGSAEFRRCLSAATLVWAVGFVVECLARIAVVVILPVGTAVWAVNIVPAVAITGCVVVQGRWVGRLVRMIRRSQAEHDREPAIRPLSLAA